MRFRVVMNVRAWLLLQNLLLTVGVSACGTVAGGLSVYLVLRALFPFPRGMGSGVAGLWWVVFIAGGMLLGAIAGFVGHIFRIHPHDSKRWSPATWTGVFLGLLLGVVIGSTLFQRSDDLKIVLILVVSAACATLDGTAANFVGFLRRDLKDTRHDSKDIF